MLKIESVLIVSSLLIPVVEENVDNNCFLFTEHVTISRTRDAPRPNLGYPHSQLHEPAIVRAWDVPTAPFSGQLRSGATAAPSSTPQPTAKLYRYVSYPHTPSSLACRKRMCAKSPASLLYMFLLLALFL